MSDRIGLEIVLASGSESGVGSGHTEMTRNEPAETFIFGLQPMDVTCVPMLCGKNTNGVKVSVDTPAITLTTVERNLQRCEPPFNNFRVRRSYRTLAQFMADPFPHMVG
jgi:hypothetical protein